MGIGEILFIVIICSIMIIGGIRNAISDKKSGRNKEHCPPTQPNQDLERIRQMKEWDRWDDSKSGKS